MSPNQTNTLHFSLHKRHSSFVYFTLEANEGLGFYSTLEHETGSIQRTIEFTYHLSLKREVESVIDHLKKNIPMEITAP